jgi:hypothetical protein
MLIKIWLFHILIRGISKVNSKNRPAARIASQELPMIALEEILYPNSENKRAQVDVSH